MIGTNLDITDRKRIEEALQSVAQSDALTGLASRVLFDDRLRHSLARSRRAGSRAALDRFKRVNDTLGHAAGDALLKEPGHAVQVAEKVLDTMRAPTRAEGHDVLVTTSIGLAYSDGDEDEGALLKRADAALYQAKAAGRNAFRIAA